MKNVPEIKVGYLVELIEGDEKHRVIVNYRNDGELGFSNGISYGMVNNLNKYDRKLIAVYGRSNSFRQMNELDIDNRELLWKIEDEVKEMTLEEIIEELGYEIKIVK